MKNHCGLVNDEYIPAPRVQDALSHQLKALGFGAMAEDVLTEECPINLRRYAKCVFNNAPSTPDGDRVRHLLRMLKLA